MGLFKGLIKDSPATFAINGIRAQKGRMAKAKRKRSRKRTYEATVEVHEPYHVLATRYSLYATGAGVLMAIGGRVVGSLALFALAIGFSVLSKFLKKSLDNAEEDASIQE